MATYETRLKDVIDARETLKQAKASLEAQEILFESAYHQMEESRDRKITARMIYENAQRAFNQTIQEFTP